MASRSGNPARSIAPPAWRHFRAHLGPGVGTLFVYGKRSGVSFEGRFKQCGPSACVRRPRGSKTEPQEPDQFDRCIGWTAATMQVAQAV